MRPPCESRSQHPAVTAAVQRRNSTPAVHAAAAAAAINAGNRCATPTELAPPTPAPPGLGLRLRAPGPLPRRRGLLAARVAQDAARRLRGRRGVQLGRLRLPFRVGCCPVLTLTAHRAIVASQYWLGLRSPPAASDEARPAITGDSIQGSGPKGFTALFAHPRTPQPPGERPRGGLGDRGGAPQGGRRPWGKRRRPARRGRGAGAGAQRGRAP